MIMRASKWSASRLGALLVPVSALAFAACADGVVQSTPQRETPLPRTTVQTLDCVADARAGTVSCGEVSASGGASRVVIGRQNVHVRLISSNPEFTETGAAGSGTGTFSFDVRVQNLLGLTPGTIAQSMATRDGVTPDSNGIRVFFEEITVTSAGPGTEPATIDVANKDGQRAFIGSEAKPYFQYSRIGSFVFGTLVGGETSPLKTWQLALTNVNTFSFRVLVSTELSPGLVINEVFANPDAPLTEPDGEWFEIYNAGINAVNLNGFVVADSSGGATPVISAHTINAPNLSVAPGGYLVLARTGNAASNGGVPFDYVYGSTTGFQLANALDAIKILSPAGNTIDRVAYTTAQTGNTSRELIDPFSDNANMSGRNWGDATATATYNASVRATPKARNSAVETFGGAFNRN